MPNSNSLATERSILENLFQDLSLAYPPISKEFSKDLRKILKRVDSEGLPFLTIKLPSMAKAVLQGFRVHHFVGPEGFSCKKGTKLPILMYGLLRQLFDDDGRELKDASPDIVRDVLQVFGLFYKCEYPYTQEQKARVIENFIAVENELEGLQISWSSTMDAAVALIEDVFKEFNPMDIMPQHGPGSVATREAGPEKWVFKRKYESIHKVYPYYEYFVPSREHLLNVDGLRWYKNLQSEEIGTAKVALVNKDSRGPRLISLEPLEFQFIQQGLHKSIRDHIESHSLTRGRVNFRDQGINRDLAARHSFGGDYATLDMKEASDRVSVALVERLFSRVPRLLESLLATRTEATLLPDKRIVAMRKFAPMGSATCFPIEAMCFWSLAEAIRRREHIPGHVFVYGDDIIVPYDLAQHLFVEFPKYGLKFNEDKCFTEGYFRESCGMDAFKGENVAPIRMRKPWPSKKSGNVPSVVAASVALCNHFYKGGFWSTARYLESRIRAIVPSIAYNDVACDRFALNRVTRGPVFGKDPKPGIELRYNVAYHLLEVKVAVQRDKAHLLVPSLWDIQKGKREEHSLPFEKGTGKLFAALLRKQCDKWSKPYSDGFIEQRWQPYHLFSDRSPIYPGVMERLSAG